MALVHRLIGLIPNTLPALARFDSQSKVPACGPFGPLVSPVRLASAERHVQELSEGQVPGVRFLGDAGSDRGGQFDGASDRAQPVM